MPTSNKGRGRPKTGRVRVVCRFTKAEKERLDQLRKTKPRGVYLGKLVMREPLSPFESFRLLKK